MLLLHHSISSGEPANHDWLPFPGMELPRTDLDARGPAGSVFNLAVMAENATTPFSFPEPLWNAYSGDDPRR
jgi:hypothetical protein